MGEAIAAVELACVSVTPNTTWTFLTMTDVAGRRGVGEATLNGREKPVLAAAERHGRALLGQPAEEARLAPLLPFGDLPEAAFSSAAQQAAADLDAQAAGVSLADALGGRLRSSTPLYANINRRTRDRSADGFAASARDAVAAGFSAFKIAPFDGLEPAMDRARAAPLIQDGLDRIAATRDAVGPAARLMVDCHWRFDEATALAMLEALRPYDLYWFECPIPDEAASGDALRRIRSRANALGVRLAGAETAVLLDGFRPMLEAEAYDAMMPDVKYAGGPAEMMRIAEAFAAAGVDFSPHNPSGPICHAMSLQICMAAAAPDLLESQFDETPLFDDLQAPAAPTVETGAAPGPQGSGLGVGLDQARMEKQNVVARWRVSAN